MMTPYIPGTFKEKLARVEGGEPLRSVLGHTGLRLKHRGVVRRLYVRKKDVNRDRAAVVVKRSLIEDEEERKFHVAKDNYEEFMKKINSKV